MPKPSGIFDPGFLVALEVSVKIHHIIYAKLPPQGIYFEALVEESFRKIKKPFTVIERGGRTAPGHDLKVENRRISLKTETGAGTRADRINITKLCTTERHPWDAPTLVQHALEHLSRYDIILMLRTVWDLPLIHYQLLEIPVRTLRLIKTANVQPVGRSGAQRQSLGALVARKNRPLFNVFFDGTDGKCAIRNFQIGLCAMLEQWDIKVPED
jgi:hypothetical protein